MRKNAVALGPISLNRTRTGAKPIPVAPASRAAKAKRVGEESKVGRVDWQGLVGRPQRVEGRWPNLFVSGETHDRRRHGPDPSCDRRLGLGMIKARMQGGQRLAASLALLHLFRVH